MKILSERLVNKNVHISFGQVSAYTDACKSIEGSCFGNNEFAHEIVSYYKILDEETFGERNPLPYPEPRLNYCCADYVNSFVIDSEGYMYKCWNNVGDTESAVANINDEMLDILTDKNAEWTEYSPIVDEKCNACEVLPICMGGCPYNRRFVKNTTTCDLIKYNIKDVMLEYYKRLKEE
jgi:uncharacterized protein